MARPCANVDEKKLKDLHGQGYTDQAIALKLNTSRTTVLRKRRKLGLSANRQVGDRGISVKDDEAYWLLVRRSLQYIGHYLAEAAREYYKETKDWERYFITMVLEPKPMFHPIPGPYTGDPEKMNYKNTKYITDFEKSMGHVGLAGVPGPAVLELIRVYKNGDEALCKKLAREAVETAGFVRTDDKVWSVEIKKCITPEEYKEYWEKQEMAAMDWTPVKDWGIYRERVFKDYSNYSSGTGKRGSTGNIRTIEGTQAFLGAMGY